MKCKYVWANLPQNVKLLLQRLRVLAADNSYEELVEDIDKLDQKITVNGVAVWFIINQRVQSIIELMRQYQVLSATPETEDLVELLPKFTYYSFKLPRTLENMCDIISLWED